MDDACPSKCQVRQSPNNFCVLCKPLELRCNLSKKRNYELKLSCHAWAKISGGFKNRKIEVRLVTILEHRDCA